MTMRLQKRWLLRLALLASASGFLTGASHATTSRARLAVAPGINLIKRPSLLSVIVQPTAADLSATAARISAQAALNSAHALAAEAADNLPAVSITATAELVSVPFSDGAARAWKFGDDRVLELVDARTGKLVGYTNTASTPNATPPLSQSVAAQRLAALGQALGVPST